MASEGGCEWRGEEKGIEIGCEWRGDEKGIEIG